MNGKIIGCGALHLYGMHLAEIRSIAVTPSTKGLGAGRKLVEALLKEAERHEVTCVCLFTRIPEFFAHMGFSLAKRDDLPTRFTKTACIVPRSTRAMRLPCIAAKFPNTAECATCRYPNRWLS